MGRFINADSYVSTGQGIVGHNMFAYCNNNPIIRVDPSGSAFTDIFAVYFGQGEFSTTPTRLCIPNAKRTDTFGEMVDVTVDFFYEIVTSEPIQTGLEINRIRAGISKICQGIKIILIIPDPTFGNELYGGGLLAWGFGQAIMGIGDLLGWKEEKYG